ncbi:terpene synthase family protein [Streptomyces sp. NPDC056244]|uniref:terpene synthase family protein n=1 Tax=Streptomyces sp. NPDC056244 TaxID=3345762 RepID=UPI0035DAA50D
MSTLIPPEALQVPPGTSYHMPDTGDQLPYAYSRFAADLLPVTKERVRTQLIACVGRPLADKILGQDGIAEWACHVYPNGDRQRTDVLIDAGLCSLACDDEFTLTGLSTDLEQVRRRAVLYTRVLAGMAPPPDVPSAVWLARSMADIEALSSTVFSARFRRIWADINQTVPVEAEHRLTRMLPGWDEYVAFRRVNLYGYWAVAACEFSAGVDMTQLLEQHTVLRDLELAAVEHIMFTNDLYSFPKEARAGEIANTFWLLRRDGMSIQEAVDFLAEQLVTRQDRFLALREKVRASPLGLREDVRLYLPALSYGLGGNLRYHRTTGRYHGADYDGLPITGGTVVIGERATLFRPDAPRGGQ